MEVAGYVLAGGRSSRMGRNKALLVYRGETFLAGAVRKLAAVCAQVTIVGGGPELAQYGRVIPDWHVESGPLGGLVAALRDTSCTWNLFLPVDVPRMPVAALRGLLEAAGSCDAAFMTDPEGNAHPLCALLSQGCLPEMQTRLESGRLKVLPAIKAAAPGAVAWRAAEASWLNNVNTPEEYAELIAQDRATSR